MNNTTEDSLVAITECDAYADMWYVKVSIYAMFPLAVPLHILLILLLLLRIPKKRKYHVLIIIQSTNDIVKLSGSVLYASTCALFNLLLPDYSTNPSGALNLILSIILMLYWKTVIRPQQLIDASLYLVALFGMVGIIAQNGIFRLINLETEQIVPVIIGYSIAAEIFIAFTGFLTLLLVMKMDVSTFSEVTVKGQKKLAIALFFQLILVLLSNLFDIYSACVDYYLATATFLTEAYEQIAKEPDMAVKYQIAGEVQARLKNIFDVLSIVQKTAAIWDQISPLCRGILMWWAIKPLLQKKEAAIVNRSTTQAQSYK